MSIFWLLMRPLWPPVRFVMRLLGLHPVSKKKLAPTLLGHLKHDKTPRELREYLKNNGFRHDPLGWIDDEEVLGLRKFDTPQFQYHVRLYKNGEIRGHHEVAPEYNYIHHLRGPDTHIGDLPELLKDWIV